MARNALQGRKKVLRGPGRSVSRTEALRRNWLGKCEEQTGLK